MNRNKICKEGSLTSKVGFGILGKGGVRFPNHFKRAYGRNPHVHNNSPLSPWYQRQHDSHVNLRAQLVDPSCDTCADGRIIPGYCKECADSWTNNCTFVNCYNGYDLSTSQECPDCSES